MRDVKHLQWRSGIGTIACFDIPQIFYVDRRHSVAAEPVCRGHSNARNFVGGNLRFLLSSLRNRLMVL